MSEPTTLEDALSQIAELQERLCYFAEENNRLNRFIHDLATAELPCPLCGARTSNGEICGECMKLAYDAEHESSEIIVRAVREYDAIGGPN